ncbi:uncharacterized protein LOC135502133 isoform X2 [Lineus longissimus]
MARSTLLSSWLPQLRPRNVWFPPSKVGNFHRRISCRSFINLASVNFPATNRASLLTTHVGINENLLGQVHTCSWSHQNKIQRSQNLCSRITCPIRTFCTERSSVQSVTSSADVSDCTVDISTNDAGSKLSAVATVLSHLQNKSQDRDFPGLNNVAKLKMVIELFLNYGANKESVTEFLLAHSSIVVRDLDQLESAVKFLTDYGFHVSDTFKILPVVSDVFEPENRKTIIGVLELLRGYRMVDKDVIKVASTAPQIMNIKNRKILTNQIDRLGEMFNHEDLVSMIVKWPESLLADPEEMRLKYEYIVDTMNVKYTQLVRSNALSQPFQHIKARHLFLLRVGLFEQPDKNQQTKRLKNPSLLAMMDATDEKFMAKLGAGMTVSDYQTFCEVLTLEEELAEDEEFDSNDSGIDGYKRGQ